MSLTQRLDLGVPEPEQAVAQLLWGGNLCVHAPTVPNPVRMSQSDSVHLFKYRIRMKATEPSTYLWANICSLMKNPSPTIDAATERCKVPRGTVQRIKAAEGHRSTDTLACIASAFGLEVWQLLVPGIKADQAPKLSDDQGVFTPELMAELRRQDGAELRKLENQLRAAVDMDPLPRVANEMAA